MGTSDERRLEKEHVVKDNNKGKDHQGLKKGEPSNKY